MNYAEIKQYDVANGPGVRVSLFVSGCTHHCKECFNPETWDLNMASHLRKRQYRRSFPIWNRNMSKGITLLGGEPLEHSNQKGLLPLVRVIKEKYPNKSIWCFTGYDFEKDILGRMVNEWEETRELLSYIEVLVDGEFMIDKKDLGLVFRGSSNQRNILVQESLKSGKICLWTPAV